MLVCIEYIPIPPLRIGHVLMHVFRYVFARINYWYVPIHTKYTSNTCKIRTNTDWYVSIHTRHVSIHALNTYKNTYQNTYQYGAVVLVRICTYQVSIRALHFPDGTRSPGGQPAPRGALPRGKGHPCPPRLPSGGQPGCADTAGGESPGMNRTHKGFAIFREARFLLVCTNDSGLDLVIPR